MAQKQGSTLVGGPGGEATRELLRFDVLGIQFHGSKVGQRPGRGSRGEGGSCVLTFWGFNFMAQKQGSGVQGAKPSGSSCILMFWVPNFMAQKHVKYFVIWQFWVSFVSHHSLACAIYDQPILGGGGGGGGGGGAPPPPPRRHPRQKWEEDI
jgi:hypothetical protein